MEDQIPRSNQEDHDDMALPDANSLRLLNKSPSADFDELYHLLNKNFPTNQFDDQQEHRRPQGKRAKLTPKSENSDSTSNGSNDSMKSVEVPVSQMTLKQAFEMLRDVHFEELRGVNSQLHPVTTGIPSRASASPIFPWEPCFFVDPSLRTIRKKRQRQGGSDEGEDGSISVKYQSFYNAEVYWAPEHELLLGVCARGMSKRSRGSTNTKLHGYSGRWFTLLKRSPKERDESSTKRLRELVIPGISLVQFWWNPVQKKRGGRRTLGLSKPLDEESVSSDQMSASATENAKVIKGDMHVLGDLCVEGDLTLNNLTVRGKLLVEGGISGQLVTPTGAADYAEWFGFLQGEDMIEPAMVVQLRSPQQKITLDTSGEGPIMITSTSPSVAAGVPYVGASDGALCAFLGQVPVRVKGEIQVGDFIYPSRKNDGYAVAGEFIDHRGEEPIGTAMTPSQSKEGIVLCFVRWRENVKWQKFSSTFEKTISIGAQFWRTVLYVEGLNLSISLMFLLSRPTYQWSRLVVFVKLMFLLHCIYSFPAYEFFENRKMWFIWVFDLFHGIIEVERLYGLFSQDAPDAPALVFTLVSVVSKVVLFEQSLRVLRNVNMMTDSNAEYGIKPKDMVQWGVEILQKRKYL